MGNGRRAIIMALMSRLGVTNPYALRDFTAINAINHSCATGKCINSRLGYIKRTSLGKMDQKKKKNIRLQNIYQSLSDLSIRGYLAGATLVSFIFISCFLNNYKSSSIGIDEEHTDEVDFELHQLLQKRRTILQVHPPMKLYMAFNPKITSNCIVKILK